MPLLQKEVGERFPEDALVQVGVRCSRLNQEWIQPGTTCFITAVLQRGVGELLSGNGGLVHQATLDHSEGRHTLVVGTFGGSVFLATTGAN